MTLGFSILSALDQVLLVVPVPNIPQRVVAPLCRRLGQSENQQGAGQSSMGEGPELGRAGSLRPRPLLRELVAKGRAGRAAGPLAGDPEPADPSSITVPAPASRKPQDFCSAHFQQPCPTLLSSGAPDCGHLGTS